MRGRSNIFDNSAATPAATTIEPINYDVSFA